MQHSLIVPFDTLLNVFFFLLQAHLLSIVSDHITHLVHFLLDSAATFCDLTLTRLLLLNCDAHIGLQLVGIRLFTSFEFGHALSFFVHIVFNDLHCSLTFLYFQFTFMNAFFFKVSGQLGTSGFFLFLTPRELLYLLLLRLLHHFVTHLLLLSGLDQLLCLLLALNLQVFLGLFEHFSVKLLSFLEVFRSELLPQLDLIVEYFPDLLDLLYLNLLLLLELLFVQLLSELLDFAPLVITYVRRHVFNF